MAGEMEQELPVQCNKDGTQIGEGCLTPGEIKTLDTFGVLPKRVIPIIFLPGIMGTNLRLTPERQEEMGRKDNIAWHPDDSIGMLAFGKARGDERQRLLDPAATEVDSLAPDADQKTWAAYTKRAGVKPDANSPYLRNDYLAGWPQYPSRKSASRKACERGWGELFYSSYAMVLNRMETMLNAAFSSKGKLNPDWNDIINADPKGFGATTPGLPPVTENELCEVVDDCMFPVHVCGYNWLQSNGESAKKVAVRIEAIMADYRKKKRRCEKVIVVTHSMGGLVARALCHPAYGNFQDKVLGVVHGVQPAIGAGAAYYRMLAGWEDGGSIMANAIGWAIGGTGPKVTPILGNGCGGMELLPNEAYGNGWLQIVDAKNRVLRSLPEKGDPYEEIYMRDNKDVWWGLLRADWINPARQPKAGLENTIELLKNVRKFHRDITPYYHPLSYAHYACDPQRRAFKNVVWNLKEAQLNRYSKDLLHNKEVSPKQLDALPVIRESGQGEVILDDTILDPAFRNAPRSATTGIPAEFQFSATMRPPADPGDQTVPMDSAEHQLHSGKFKGIFRQTGYEHQGSYQDEKALASTLYSIVQIAKTMKWD
jgi:pimeloyl-ACP methyl ester carboxylesterase